MAFANSVIQEQATSNYLQPLLDNLLELLEQETEHLNSGNVDMFEVFAKKKMQSLAELNVFIKKGNMRNTTRLYAHELRKIDGLLKENIRKLQFRLKAIGEITDTIESAVSAADSDGTYEAGYYRAQSQS